MINIAYLIMCHKNPEQVTRLVSKLKSKNSTCFVHVDKEAGFDTSVIVNGGVLTSNRFHGVLGSYSLVQISNELLLTAREYGEKNAIRYQYFCLLSGQDYLLQNVEDINGQLEKAYPRPYIDCTPWAKGNWVDAGSHNCCWFMKIDKEITRRMPKLSLKRKIIKAPFVIANRIFRNKMNVKQLFARNKVDLYGGSAWWILPDDMVDYILEINKDWGKSCKFYPLIYTLVPEETYYQTLLMNSSYKNRVTVNPPDMVQQNCKTYANFSSEGKNFTGHPHTLTMSDSKKLKELSSTKFFARKFDDTVDSDVFEWIDQNLLYHKVR